MARMTTDPRVDAYLATRPPDQQEVLGQLRARIRELAPDAVETISYGMPAFEVDGRFFVSYAGWKGHCAIYPIDDELLARHANEIRGYARTKGSLHFSAAKPLPDGLIRDVVQRRADHARERAGY